MAMPSEERPATLARPSFFRTRVVPIFRPRAHAYKAPSGYWLLLAVLVGIAFWAWIIYELVRALF